MARVTVEDCLDYVENRFELVLKASRRAHDLELGAVDPMVSEDNDKPTVIALREIAAGYDVTSKVDSGDVEKKLTATVLVSANKGKQPTAAEDTSV